MKLPLECVPGRCKVHTAIRFLTAKNLSVSVIHQWLQNMYGVNVMPKCTVHSWVHSRSAEYVDSHP